jgi:dUTP pyrophosphatase
MNIIIKLEDGAQMPLRGSEQAAGWDLYNNEAETVYIAGGGRKKFKTGVSVALPKGTYWKIESRSGLASKLGVHAIGGVIDSDYRGEVSVILVNSGLLGVEIPPGAKIAQAILLRHEELTFEFVEELPNDTERGTGGFGHTGQ